MAQNLSVFEEQGEGKLAKKFKDNPFFPVACVGFACIAAYGLYGLRKRQMPMSLYLIHLRMASQGFAVGVLGIGMSIALGKKMYHRLTDKPETRSTHST